MEAFFTLHHLFTVWKCVKNSDTLAYVVYCIFCDFTYCYQYNFHCTFLQKNTQVKLHIQLQYIYWHFIQCIQFHVAHADKISSKFPAPHKRFSRPVLYSTQPATVKRAVNLAMLLVTQFLQRRMTCWWWKMNWKEYGTNRSWHGTALSRNLSELSKENHGNVIKDNRCPDRHSNRGLPIRSSGQKKYRMNRHHWDNMCD